MSSRHNRRKRRIAQTAQPQAPVQAMTQVSAEIGVADVPMLIERVQRETQQSAQTYEEANWAKLSPSFRAAHNRLRVTRGLPPIPAPKIDLYVAKQAMIKPFDPTDKEFVTSVREFMGPTLMGGRQGDEGLTINGQTVRP